MVQMKRTQTLAEKAYDEIKNALCNHAFTSGSVLSENQLAKQLNMSRTPVREALRALQKEGWLEIQNGVGAYIKPLFPKDIADLYEIRCLLEVQAAKTSVYLITDEDIVRLEQDFRSMLIELKKGKQPDHKFFSSLDWILHELIVDRCQNGYIKEIMHDNTSNMKRYLSLSAEALNDLKESILQHLNILSLIKLKRTDELCLAIQKHLQWASSCLVAPGPHPL